jgi:FlaG/FlaF family flagellin (archaellin)
MSLRERWAELDTGMKVFVGIGVAMVVGVFLLVALVLGSAILASFVLGVGSEVPDTPQASMTVAFETVDGEPVARVTHDGGDTLQSENIWLRVNETSYTWDTEDGEITAGDRTTVPAPPGSTVRLIWMGPDGASATLMRAEAPDDSI